MATPARSILDAVLGALPDWMFLASGLTLLSLALVTPNWLSTQALARQRDLMRVQAQRLQQQEARYATFYGSLLEDDPVLLERLAFTQLGLKPVGKEMLDRADRGDGLDAAEARRRADLLATSASIDQWLLEPLPEPGVDLPVYQPADSRLVRLTANPALRAGLIAAAIACLAAGLWPTSYRSESSAPAPARRAARAAG